MQSKRSRRGGIFWFRLLALIAPFVVLAAAVSVRAGSSELLLEVNGRSVRFPVSVAEIGGDDVSIIRTPEDVTGRVTWRKVDLALAPGKIAGTYGDRAVVLDVKRSGPALLLDGTYGDEVVKLSSSPTTISGVVGICEYSLEFSGDRYAGFRICQPGQRPTPVAVELPETLLRESDPSVGSAMFLTFAPDGLFGLVPGPGSEAIDVFSRR